MIFEKFNIFNKVKSFAKKVSNNFSDKINEIFYQKKLDQKALNDLEDLLISSDVGFKTTEKILKIISNKRFGKEVSAEEIKQDLVEIIKNIIDESTGNLNDVEIKQKRTVFVMCGVNGNGKTTSIGKLANIYQKNGYKVIIAACDTFRAAAPEQLEIWAKRSGTEIFYSDNIKDPSAMAYQAMNNSVNHDILFIDTAGRLQNQKNLMDEFKKIISVIKKHDESAPHEIFLVIDATTGQNAISQIEKFLEMVKVTGLIITKTDGTAKAGVVINIADKFKIPVKFIAFGEGIDDIEKFNSEKFVKRLVGLI